MTGSRGGDHRRSRLRSSRSSRRGHRLSPHTADCIVEAWGPDRSVCFGEAMEGLVEVFASINDHPSTLTIPVSVGSGDDDEVLVALLEEVIYVVDALGLVPVRVQLTELEDGGVSGGMEVVSASDVELIGPVPKAVSYYGLRIGKEGPLWRCRVLIDV